MAERRMFAKTIIDSDAFLDMSMSAQCLYFHLAMRADDEGFLNNPKKIQRMIGASDDDLRLLLAKRFILAFDTGVIVIKHWKIHNYIRNDRFKPTVYEEEKAQLSTKENGAYTLGIPDGSQLVYQVETQDRLGKVRIGKDRINNNAPAREDEDEDDGFDAFWAAYPRKSGDIKAACFEYQGVIQSGVSPETLLEAVRWQAEAKGQYMPNAEKWLRNKGWTEQRREIKPDRNAPPSMVYGPVSAEDYDFKI